MQNFVQIFFTIMILLLLTNCRAMKAKKLSSIQEIERLKKGALLVRLKTSQSKIAKLNEIGQTREARKIKAEQIEENKQIIRAFREYFDFCPVYFFTSDNSNNIRSSDLQNIFINENLKIADSLQFSGDFLTAEFARTQDTATKDENGNRVANNFSYGLLSLIVMDKNFVQMAPPFPAAFRTTMIENNSGKIKAIQNLNKAMFYFYYEGKRWKAKKMMFEEN